MPTHAAATPLLTTTEAANYLRFRNESAVPATAKPHLPSAPPARVRPKLACSLVSFDKGAANDDPAQSPSFVELERFPGLRLDEMIREIVRAEVRAEVARAIANAPAPPTHVSVAEYAVARSISVSTVRNAIRAGRLPAMRIGTAVRVPVEAEIGRAVIATANGRDANPVMRAEEILTSRIARSLDKSNARRVA